MPASLEMTTLWTFEK